MTLFLSVRAFLSFFFSLSHPLSHTLSLTHTVSLTLSRLCDLVLVGARVLVARLALLLRQEVGPTLQILVDLVWDSRVAGSGIRDVFKAHRLWYRLHLGLRVIHKQKKEDKGL